MITQTRPTAEFVALDGRLPAEVWVSHPARNSIPMPSTMGHHLLRLKFSHVRPPTRIARQRKQATPEPKSNFI